MNKKIKAAVDSEPHFKEGMWCLPDEPLLGFVEVPAGVFLMGSDKGRDKDADENELPQHKVELPAFYMGRYPVTVGQFRKFIEESGYTKQDPDALVGPSNHPVVWITWDDALAYCTWLDEALRRSKNTPAELVSLFEIGWQVLLPSEAEWEKAARGVDGRIYAWGDVFAADKANTEEMGIGSRSEVGRFPTGVSPYGLLDMCGNVWEWTCSLNIKYPYPAEGKERQEREDLEFRGMRVARGGSFYYFYRRARCAARSGYPQDFKDKHHGFRVTLSHSSP